MEEAGYCYRNQKEGGHCRRYHRQEEEDCCCDLQRQEEEGGCCHYLHDHQDQEGEEDCRCSHRVRGGRVDWAQQAGKGGKGEGEQYSLAILLEEREEGEEEEEEESIRLEVHS